MTTRKKRKTEFSKLILGVASGTNLLVVVFACVMIWRTNDLSPLAYLIPAVAAEVGTGRAFYYNKAKTENLVKLQSIYRDMPILGRETNEQEENAG